MKKLLLLCALLMLSTGFLSNAIGADKFVEGKDYKLVIPKQHTSSGDDIEIVELFWYGCPHCFRFQPYINRYLKKQPKGVKWVRMPAILMPHWKLHAQAFYTAQALNIEEEINQPFFDEIHVKKNKLGSEASLASFFERYDVDKKKFKNTFKSFFVNSKVQRADQMTKRYGVHGTPSVVVNGKYLIDSEMAKNWGNFIKIIKFLVEKEKSAKS